jgi:NAD(P)-dependent dehydrogenase (short-subunit alcohol dehydrogenase family)
MGPVMSVNLHGLFLCARGVSGDEGAGQGNIINIASSTFFIAPRVMG